MKRFSKILVAVLALCLLVGALALAISANYSGVEGKFVVNGEGYDTWNEAVEAAANTYTIYLNEDWNLDTGLTLSGEDKDLKLNLNGKTVNVADGSMFFNVHTGAKLTIEGEGTLNNSGTVLIGGSSSGVVTINATGSGIVINNNLNDTGASVNTFRFQSRSTLNIYGKIVVNTNGDTSTRAFINTQDTGKKTVNLNIKDADILYANPTVEGCPAGQMIYTQYSNVNIENSKLEVVYGYVIYSNTSGQTTIGGYMKDVSDETTMKPIWDPDKISAAKAGLSMEITETITATNSVFSSILSETYTGSVRGSLMYLNGGAVKGDFTNCEFYGYSRTILGKQGDTSWRNHFGATVDDSKVASKATDSSQLTFVDCHFRHNKAHSEGSYLFCYGPNVRVYGGSISGFGSLANCQPHYLELDNGQWLGVYVDNVLGVSGLKGYAQDISSAWQNTADWNHDAEITGTLPQPVSITVGGKTESFTTGYFSDMDKFNAYFATGATPSWRDYISIGSNDVPRIADGSNITATGDYLTGEGATGTYPFAAIGGNGQDKGVASSVLGTNKKGEPNGYVKFHLDSNTSGSNSTSSKYTYFQTPTGADGSILTNKAFVIEFDLSTDTGMYPKVSMTFQGRQYFPRYDKDGKLLGVSNAGLQIGAVDYTPTSSLSIGTNAALSYNGKYVTLPTTAGDWARVTLILEFENTGVLEDVTVPVYAKNGSTNSSGKEVFDLVADATTTVKATKLTKYNCYMYVDGELVTTFNYNVSTIGYNGYIPEGTEGNFYIDGLRISHTGTANRDESWCIDNVRVSKYEHTDNVDLGYLNESGEPKQSIAGLSHFLVMPDNMAVAPLATVDGVEYTSEADVIAAITEGSTVKLFKNFESLIEANVSFKLEPNGFAFPGFVSATHTPIDYVGSFGYYKLVPASASELYTVSYSFNGVTKTQTVAKGTVIPAMKETFPSKIEGNAATSVTRWTLPVSVPTDYNWTGLEIVATPVTDTQEFVVIAGGVGYETLEEAIAGANGETIVLYGDVTVNEMIYVDGITVKIDLNGKTITAGEAATTLFNVRYGANFTITGKGTIDNVSNFVSASNLTSETSSTVNVEADGATTGIVINHRAVAGDADKVSTFRFHDKSVLNVSGFITVNAYNGIRQVFNVTSGSGTQSAKALNISKAKVYVPLLTKEFEDKTNSSTPGYSQLVCATDNITINVADSELRAEYGQLFNIAGTYPTKSVSSYWVDNNWTENAASGVTIDAPNIFLTVEDSTLFSDYSSFSTKFTASGHNPGASIMYINGKADAKFDNCIIYSDFRAITSSEAFTATSINQHQILFKDCHVFDAPGDNNGAPFFVYGCNYKIIGGTWYNANAISNGSKYYLALDNGQWIGGYMDGTLVNSARAFSTSGVTGNWVDSTYTENLINCNLTRVIDGNSYTFKAAYYSDFDSYIEEFKAYNALGAYNNTGDETPSPFPNFSVGVVNGTVTKDGGYVKHFYSEATGTKYNNLDGNNDANWHFGNLAAYVWEFDVSTDDGKFANTNINIEARYKSPNFDASGKYTGLGATAYAASYSLYISGDTATFDGKSVKISTEKGDWTRITFVYNIPLGEESTKTIESTTAGTNVDVKVVDLTKTTMSVYVDGVLLDSYNPITTGNFLEGTMAVDAMAGGYIDDVRIKSYPTAGDSICYDNILFMPIYRSAGLDLGFDQNGKPAESIVGNSIFLSMPSSDAKAPVVKVDGENYTSIADANAAIKEGSFVELLANVDEAIEINYNNVKFKDNGKSFPGFISSAYKFVDYTAARNAKYSALADASEIVVIEYPEYLGVSGSQSAVIGTLLKAPAEFDAVSKKFNENDKNYQVLNGWSLSDTEDVQLITAAGVAYPKYEFVKAVVVNWTDASGNVLDTDFYLPGDATVLDEFDGEDIAVDYTQNDYYGVARTGWNAEQLAAATAGLATGGEYNIAAVMGKVAPMNFPGLKYNLSLYSNYVMNFYVPTGIEGITDVVISTIEDGSAAITKFEEGTLSGVAVQKYGYMLGIADTEIQTFWLVYNVGEDRISFPIYVGVPTYATIIMDMYDEDSSAKGEATKALIVNMANYATKVLALNGGDMTTGGAKIYADIVTEYGASYLSDYNGLTNERFAENGDLYNKHGVAELNFRTGTDEKAENVEAISYIESISFNFNTFEPAYLIKYSDKAINKGLQDPSYIGWTDYFTAGIHVYAGYNGTYCTQQWAEKDGVKTYGGDLWAYVDEDGVTIKSNGDTSYDYYALVANSTWTPDKASKEYYYELDSIRNNLDIQVYWSYRNEEDSSVKVTDTVGHVYYNLAAYINDMINEDASANAGYIDAAKALYAYSYVSAAYKTTN